MTSASEASSGHPAALVLASASPARHRLLEQAGIRHRVEVSGVDEDSIADPDPRRLVVRLAEAKAAAVASVLPASPTDPQAVLGCDSLLVFDGQGYGKPTDAAQAVTRWRRMAGRVGELITGHCLIRGEQRLVQAVSTRVWFTALSEAEIELYVATGEPLACAGGFALEGRGALVVERLEGCWSNVIGLSLPLLRRWLGGLEALHLSEGWHEKGPRLRREPG